MKGCVAHQIASNLASWRGRILDEFIDVEE